MPELRGYRALVTGASSGIGRELGRQLAAQGCDLVLTARRLDRLEELAAELRAAHHIDVRCVPADLADPAAPARLVEATVGTGLDIDILVNNAGFGDYDRFADQSWERNRAMLQVNVVAPAELSHRLVGPMRGRERRGYVLNIASIAAYQPVPFFATYAATKHYLQAFSLALAHELAGTNVSVTCVCPGGVRTEFIDGARQKVRAIGRWTLMSPDKVARISLRAMLARRRNLVIGLINKVACFFVGLLPRRAAAAASLLVLDEPDSRPQVTSRSGG